MNYKHKYKKTQKKQHIISLDWIKTNQFNKIIDIAVNQAQLTLRDHYLYGYALLRSQKQVEALIRLWALAAKGHAAITEDCHIIAAHLFKDTTTLFSMALSDDQLYTLFRIAQAL